MPDAEAMRHERRAIDGTGEGTGAGFNGQPWTWV